MNERSAGPDDAPPARLARFGWWLGRLCCALCGLIAALVLAGWGAQSVHLTSFSPELPAMVPNAAVALGLASVAWWLLAEPVRSRLSRRAGQLVAALVTWIGLLTLLQYGIGPLGVDHLLFRVPASFMLHPGRPALPTAVAIMAAGVSLLLLRVRSRRSVQPSDCAAAIPGVLGLAGLASYLYGAVHVYGIPGEPAQPAMTLPTALALVLLSASLLVARPGTGLAAMLLGRTMGGMIARRLILAAFLFPVFGLLVVGGFRSGFYGAELAASVITTGALVLGLLIVTVTGLKLDELDRARRRATFEQSRLAAIVESSSDAIMSATPEGEGLTWNRAAERIYGYAAPEILGDRETATRVVPPERRDEMSALLARIRRGERVEGHETERVRKDGERFHASLTMSPMFGEGGEVIGVSTITRDITPRVRAEQALRESEERYRQLFEHASDGVFIADLSGRFTDVNSAGCALLGYSRDEMLDRSVAEVIAPEDAQALAAVRERLVHGEVSVQEWQVRRKDGALVPVVASAAPVRDESGKRLGAALFMQDITALKELERQREEWTSVVAHDLRQPLGVIRFSADLLARSALPERDRKHLERVRSAAFRLDVMINDLLDASRLEADRLTLERAPEDLLVLVERILEHLAPVTSGHPVSVTRRGAFRPVLVDPGRIEQVLGNLLSNAVKYGEPGADIDLALEDQGQAALVSVTNRGRGIAADEMGRLFNRFQRSSTSKPDGVTGIGLGLYICKGLVEAHGGRVGADSTPGELTRFHFTLPYAPDSALA